MMGADWRCLQGLGSREPRVFVYMQAGSLWIQSPMPRELRLQGLSEREAAMVTILILSPSQLRPRLVGGLTDPGGFTHLLWWHFS